MHAKAHLYYKMHSSVTKKKKIYIYVYDVYVPLIAVGFYVLRRAASEEMRDMWMEVAAHPAWQTMFKFFGMKDFVEEEIERDRKERAKDGDEPQKSQTPKSGTPKKKKQKPVPQNTPEKPPMPAEMTKSSCRAADFGKPIKVEAGLKPPQKKTKSAKRKVVQEEDDLLGELAEVEPADEAEEDDEQEEGAIVPRMKRARHARTCKKKLVTNRAQQLGVVKQYLGRIGASYPEFQSTHTRPGLQQYHTTN